MLLSNPITFPVFKEGETITATVTEEIDHSVVTLYRIRFSDGFEDMFGIEHIRGQVVALEMKGAPYASAIRNDLRQVMEIDTSHFWQVFQHEIDGQLLNVWVAESRYKGQTIYRVVYSNEFRFALVRKNEKWVFVETLPELTDKDKEVAQRTGYLLDSLL